MAYRLASLLAIAGPALALSSHSPIDLESYPAYAVSFSEHQPILNETLGEILSEPLQTPPHSLPPQRHLLRTPSGQAFLCTVPSVTIASKKRARARAELDESTRQFERQKGLERGLALLEPMKAGCIYLKQNWFTYSFCYGSEIRQFHAVQVAGSPIPKEDPNSEAYVLGTSPEPSATYSANPKYGSGSLQVARKDSLIPSRLGGTEGMGLDETGRYLVQTWEGGSTCDKTGLPRSVEVQFHCNTQTIDRIALIRETSICRYVLLIHTPRLCAEPLFLEGADKSSEPASIIDCQPVVSKIHEQISNEATTGGRLPNTIDAEEQIESEPLKGHGLDAPPPAELEADSNSPTVESSSQDALPEYVDATMMLVYNTETGEIESVETTLDDHLEESLLGEAGGSDTLRRKVFGSGKGKGGEEEEDKEEGKKAISVDQLEDMVRLMADSLAEAMKGSQRPSSDGEPTNHDSPPPASDPPSSDPQSRENVMSMFKELWGTGTTASLSQEDLEKLGEAKKKLREGRKGAQNEAFEQMRRGFERKYDAGEGEEDDNGRARVRDEL